ncbi:acetyltransferase [Candidatus Pseudothioglobus sp. Uisw_050_01]|uniref:acetyltransferase n=1 Tax=Candidatus Pseudothioglobus sp. Uisw_050_01 TaxID=3230997 RepID=UPI003A8A6D35
MKRLAIFGAGGHGKVVAEIAQLSGWSDIIFFDDNDRITKLENWSIQGNLKKFLSHSKDYDGSFVAIGDNQIRLQIVKLMLSSSKNNLVTLIHPNSIISQLSKVGLGSVVMAGSIINPFSSIGISNIINTNSVIEHDNLIGDYVHISPGVNIAGSVTIGQESWIGIGSSIKQNISIGSNVIVGLGSVVLENLPDNVVAFGVPAKIDLQC